MLEHIITTPSARRLGIATALTHACLTLARTRGLGRAALTASPDGHHIYQLLGFHCTVSRYRYPAAGSRSSDLQRKEP